MPSRNRIFVPVPPDRAWEVLADPFTYKDWVVGTSEVRDADPEYPARGTRLYHRVGVGRLSIRDHTEVLEVDEGRRLVLDARVFPAGRTRVAISLEPAEGGTRVLMEEEPADAWSRRAMGGSLAVHALRLRNTEALSRFRRTALRGQIPTTDADDEPAGSGARRVLITGASSGIGLATAQLLAAQGARLALLARGKEGLEKTIETLERSPDARIYVADTTDRPKLHAAIDKAAADLGGLDAVVTSAAALGFGPFTDMDADDFDATIANVFTGTVNTVRAALPHLEQTAGTLVVIGSVLGRVPLPQLAAYSASKHAVRGFVESLRAELRDEGSPVAISEIDPWAIDTPLFDANMTSATGLRAPDSLTAYRAEDVALRIAELIENPRARVTFGGRAILARAVYDYARPLAELVLVLASRFMRAGGGAVNQSAGGLREPSGAGRVSGPLPSRRSALQRFLATAGSGLERE